MKKQILLLSALVCVAGIAWGQEELSAAQYEQLKAAGQLPAHYTVDLSAPPKQAVKGQPRPGQPKGGGTSVFCNCWIEPDSSYQLAMTPNDDGSSAPINLPFQFNLYGDLYNLAFINNNGNITFNAALFAFSAGGFPAQFDTIMVAPFWADVDTRGDDGNGLNGGQVWYKVTPTALYVNWVDVGYYNSFTDKHNSFQLIITDGTDPILGLDKNVSFCYKDMQWTTGTASCLDPTVCNYNGTDYSCNNTNNLGYGFCGAPSTVGANRGNGVDFIQFGRFNHPGIDYDGPFGAPDAVSWLDDQAFTFTTAVNTQNIPPIPSSTFLCDTVRVCTGELVDITVNFFSPEQNQTTTATSAAPTITSYPETSNTSGVAATIISQFIPTVLDVGFHTITYVATDDGTPALTTTVTIVIEIFFTPTQPPVVVGDTVACPGQGVVLTASAGFDDYFWSNGYDGASVLVGPGTYIVQATAGVCRLASDTIIVYPGTTPQPVITGQLFNCDGAPAALSTTEPFDTYLWSDGNTSDTAWVSSGTYSVTVTDVYGCEGGSATVNVVSANNPTASFLISPSNEVLPGTNVQFTDQSNGNGDAIVSWLWSVDTTAFSSQNSNFTFTTPGVYAVTLLVTTSNGCTDQITLYVTVIPEEIIVPNVFSPNNDGENDFLEFTGVEYYPNTDLRVFNRWGQTVYENTSYANTWSPKDVSEGTYFYVLRREDGTEYTGHVTLLR
ncbi:MAG: gliding motility-associated C-terminal domain-containing protein [Flavobacteriales bacterium]|nr:gliding motility-associated C-terminal domain-containing protein [Flavobacteriales bacterium]